jgi:hypothetical protein
MSVVRPLPRKALPYFKRTVYVLLALNACLMFDHRTVVAGLDALAWISLLLLLERQTGRLDQSYAPRWENLGVYGGRMLAYTLVLGAALRYSSDPYLAEHGALDLWNAWTRIALLYLLEFRVYFPGDYLRWEP